MNLSSDWDDKCCSASVLKTSVHGGKASQFLVSIVWCASGMSLSKHFMAIVYLERLNRSGKNGKISHHAECVFQRSLAGVHAPLAGCSWSLRRLRCQSVHTCLMGRSTLSWEGIFVVNVYLWCCTRIDRWDSFGGISVSTMFWEMNVSNNRLECHMKNCVLPNKMLHALTPFNIIVNWGDQVQSKCVLPRRVTTLWGGMNFATQRHRGENATQTVMEPEFCW